MTPLELLSEELKAASLPVRSIRQTEGEPYTITYTRALTAAEQTQANALVAAFNAKTSGDTRLRLLATLAIDGDRTPLARLLVAEALVLLDELNGIRAWVTSFKAAVAASTSFADLKTRVAATPSLPQRTKAQIVTALGSKLATGDADAT